MANTNPLYSHPTKPTHRRTQSQTSIALPTLKHTATRLQCLSGFKLRIESSCNEPRLRQLLGHISIYDNVREYRKEELLKMACPYPTDDADVLASPSPPPSPQNLQHQQYQKAPRHRRHDISSTITTSSIPTHTSYSQSLVPSFQDFQAAIELQLATIAQIQRSKAAALAYSNRCPTIDEDDFDDAGCVVQEYDDDSDGSSDYDSYDGEEEEEGWRDDEEDGSVTDLESEAEPDADAQRSPCSSPISEHGHGPIEEVEDYFVKPLVSLVRKVVVSCEVLEC